MGVFERYTDEAKRAIFFAQQTALSENASSINPTHILLGLLVEERSRANAIFHLRDLFPSETAKQVALGKQHVVSDKTITLSTDCKYVVAYAAHEADDLRDSKIETEHLLLGLLRKGENPVAERLRARGLDVETVRQRIAASKRSRLARRGLPLWWPHQVAWRTSHPVSVYVQIAFVVGIIVGLFLVGFDSVR